MRLKYSVNFQQPSKFSKHKNGLSWINFENIIYDPEQGINDRVLLTNKYGGRLVEKEKNGETVYEVAFSTAKPSSPDDPNTERIIEAYRFLASTGRYGMPTLDDILLELRDVRADKVDEKVIKEIEQTTDNMFAELMQKLKDPKVRAMLSSIGQYQIAESSYGWKFALNNVITIQAQNPNTTFLKQRHAWLESYNRKIKSGAKPIFVVVPSNQKTGITDAEIRKVMTEAGYGQDETFESLSPQQKEYIIITVRYMTGKGFLVQPYYDISDTYVIDGERDIWSEDPGFDNNLTGHLNDAAMADLEKRKASLNTYGYDVKELYNNEEGNYTALNDSLVKGMQKKYPELPVAKNGGNRDDIAFERNLDVLADYLIEQKAKLVRPENRVQGKNIVKTFVFCFTKLKSDRIANELKDNQILTEKAYSELRNVINEIIMLINMATLRRESKQQVNEAIPYLNSTEEMLNMMGLSMADVKNHEREMEMNDIKENFMRTLNNINKHRYYNDKIN